MKHLAVYQFSDVLMFWPSLVRKLWPMGVNVIQIKYTEYGLGVVQSYSVNYTYIKILERRHWTDNSGISVNALGKTIRLR
jgi:hypothetical protein